MGLALATVSADSIIASSRMVASAGLSLWADGTHLTNYGGFVTSALRVGSGAILWARASHSPIWRPASGADPLRALRVRDLRQLDRRLSASELRVGITRGPGLDGRNTALEAGMTGHSDGNRRVFVNVTTTAAVGSVGPLLLSVEPNGYFEGFSRGTRGLLTPSTYARGGVSLHGQTDLGSVAVRARVGAHAHRHPVGSGIGLEGGLEGSVSLGRGTVAILADFMRQGAYHFLQISTGVHATVP
jgi:hypothetical protein